MASMFFQVGRQVRVVPGVGQEEDMGVLSVVDNRLYADRARGPNRLFLDCGRTDTIDWSD
jgi:hypothetical protein